MLVILPYCDADQHLAVQLLDWIAELGGCKKHTLLLITDPKLEATRIEAVQKSARKSFKAITQITTPYRRRRADGSSGWPLNCNWAFYCACMYVAMTGRKPFLWLEPDCVPLKGGWLDELESDYELCGEEFMGDVIETKVVGMVEKYLNGTAIYPGTAMRHFDSHMVDLLNGHNDAFDMASAKTVVPMTSATLKIQHWFRVEGEPAPSFDPDPPAGWETIVLANIRPEAVLFHDCKDGSLIRKLREIRKEATLVAA